MSRVVISLSVHLTKLSLLFAQFQSVRSELVQKSQPVHSSCVSFSNASGNVWHIWPRRFLDYCKVRGLVAVIQVILMKIQNKQVDFDTVFQM